MKGYGISTLYSESDPVSLQFLPNKHKSTYYQAMDKRLLLALGTLLLVAISSRANGESFHPELDEHNAIDSTWSGEELDYFDEHDDGLIDELGVCGWSGYLDCEDCCKNQAFSKFKWANDKCECS